MAKRLKKYNKLVRDNIPEYIREKGGEPIIHVANNKEYWQKLKEKLNEELAEFMHDESIEELADLLEVVEAVIDYKAFDRKKITAIRKKKAKERGKFTKRIILEQS